MPLKRVRMRCERVLLWEYTYTTPPTNSIFFSVFKYSCNHSAIVTKHGAFREFPALFVGKMFSKYDGVKIADYVQMVKYQMLYSHLYIKG